MYICNVDTVTRVRYYKEVHNMCQGMPSEAVAVPAAVVLRVKHNHCLSRR